MLGFLANIKARNALFFLASTGFFLFLAVKGRLIKLYFCAKNGAKPIIKGSAPSMTEKERFNFIQLFTS